MQRAGVRTFQNLIVGAGPAGVAVACTLLDGGSSPTLWMDPAFQSGRLANYTEVPSNTKVSLFVKYAATPASISGRSNAITTPFEVSSAAPLDILTASTLALSAQQPLINPRSLRIVHFELPRK